MFNLNGNEETEVETVKDLNSVRLDADKIRQPEKKKKKTHIGKTKYF